MALMNTYNIKHIVLCGGAYLGLYQIGSLMELNQRGFYNIDNVKSIHGTSIGALTGILMCMKPKWCDIIDYFEKRPWQKLIQFNPNMLFEIIPKKGLLSFDFIKKIIQPFFYSNDLPIDITLSTFYEHTGIDLYLYSISLNTFECVEFSHKSHPDLEVLRALYMSCSLPYIFQPMFYNGSYYIDGGLLNSYPLANCLEYAKEDEVLSIKFGTKPYINEICEDANIFEYGYYIYRKLVKKARNNPECNIPYELIIPCIEVNMHDVNKVLYKQEVRREYIDYGISCAVDFLDEIGYDTHDNSNEYGDDEEENILYN